MRERRAEVARVFEKVRALLPEIAERAPEVEAARRVPLDLVAKLKATGCFGISVPRRLQGLEFDADDKLQLLEEIATADGAIGWTAAIGSEAPTFLNFLPPTVFAEIYSKGPDVVVAGSTSPTGKAVRAEGGYRVSGRWPWASGCLHADWLVANCVIMEDGAPKAGAMPGSPMMLIALVRPDQATIHDTWHAVGLKGTGSNDFSIDDAFVPDEHMFDLWTGKPHSMEACVLPTYVATGLVFAALAVGMAQGAVNDVVGLANDGKKRNMAALRSAEQPVFQYRLGQAETKVRTARAALHAQGRLVYEQADRLPRGFALLLHPLTKATHATGAFAARLAFEAIDTLYEIAGGSSVHERFPLQRRLRDVRALTQHLALADAMYTRHGAGLAGVEATL